jgi:hypothetical protein
MIATSCAAICGVKGAAQDVRDPERFSGCEYFPERFALLVDEDPLAAADRKNACRGILRAAHRLEGLANHEALERSAGFERPPLSRVLLVIGHCGG